MFVSREPFAQGAELRNLVCADAEVVLGLQIDRAGVLAVEFVELRADFAPDARLFGVVMDDRRTELFETMPTAQSEQILATLHVTGVAQAGMAGLKLQLRDVRRFDHHAGSIATPYSTMVAVSFMAVSFLQGQ